MDQSCFDRTCNPDRSGSLEQAEKPLYYTQESLISAKLPLLLITARVTSMNHTVSLLVLLIASSCLLSLVQSKAAATAGPQFIEFDDKSWQDALKTKDYTLILFNNPTNKACHECYIARFELEELAEDHKDENSLIIGQVDCHALPDICTQYEVFSDFPKVKLAL